MTKEEWTIIKGSNSIPIAVLHNYFVEKGGRATFDEFTAAFRQLEEAQVMTVNASDGRLIILTPGGVVATVHDYYDTKFGMHVSAEGLSGTAHPGGG